MPDSKGRIPPEQETKHAERLAGHGITDLNVPLKQSKFVAWLMDRYDEIPASLGPADIIAFAGQLETIADETTDPTTEQKLRDIAAVWRSRAS